MKLRANEKIVPLSYVCDKYYIYTEPSLGRNAVAYKVLKPHHGGGNPFFCVRPNLEDPENTMIVSGVRCAEEFNNFYTADVFGHIETQDYETVNFKNRFKLDTKGEI